MTDEELKELESANDDHPLSAADLAVMDEIRDRVAEALSGGVVELNDGRVDVFLPLDDAADNIPANLVTVYQNISRMLGEWATLDLREGDLRLHLIRRWRPDLLEAIPLPGS
jgi:hypothetical protein